MPGAIDFHCSVACAASREERLSEKIAMRMDGLPRWMREGMAAQGYTSFVACQRARAAPKKKADSEVGPYNYQRFGAMRTTKICWCAKGLRFGVEAWFDEKTGESPGGRTEGR